MSVERIGRATAWFPLAGLLVGGAGVAIGWPAGELWGAEVRAVVLVTAWAVVTAGLHLDGLADTFDGLLSWRPREQKLEIMRDSRIGTMGAIALFAILALKVALLASADGAWIVAALVAPVLGRWAGVVAIFAFPAAREGGLGRTFRETGGRWAPVVAGVTASAVAGLGATVTGILALVVVTGIALALGSWWVRSLGGLTGDTYGAASEIGEVVALAVLTAFIGGSS